MISTQELDIFMDYNESYHDVPGPIHDRRRISFSTARIAFQKNIASRGLRAMNQPTILSQMSHETEELILRLECMLLEGKESRTVEKTYEIPRYEAVHSYWPASTWDAIKRDTQRFVERLNGWMANVRWSGWLWSRTQISEVERWLKSVTIPYEMVKTIKHELIKKDKVDVLTVIKRYCPHHHGSASSHDCVHFLTATQPHEHDVTMLRSIMPYLEYFIKECSDNNELCYVFKSRGEDQFLYAFKRMQEIIQRNKNR